MKNNEDEDMDLTDEDFYFSQAILNSPINIRSSAMTQQPKESVKIENGCLMIWDNGYVPYDLDFVKKAIISHQALLEVAKLVSRLALQRGNTELNRRAKEAIKLAETEQGGINNAKIIR